MKSETTTVWSFVLGIFALGLASSLLAAEPPPPPMMVETWACSYKEGKDWGDKRKARDYLVAQIEKAGLKKTPAYHWTQKKGMVPVDTVWFDVHENVAEFGAASDAWDASGIGPGVDAQFNRVEDCTAGLSSMRVVHEQEDDAEAEEDDTTLISNLACTFKDGSGFAQMPDLMQHIGTVMSGMGADGPGFAAVRQPITGGPNFPDVFLFSVFDDMTHWSKYVAQLFGTDAGQRMRNHMNMVLDCSISMWDGQMVVAPDDE
ncbi:MAG: hypothetical protein ACR2PZ_20080 [Pseudomonadales bacterium]